MKDFQTIRKDLEQISRESDSHKVFVATARYVQEQMDEARRYEAKLVEDVAKYVDARLSLRLEQDNPDLFKALKAINELLNRRV